MVKNYVKLKALITEDNFIIEAVLIQDGIQILFQSGIFDEGRIW